MGNSQEKFIKEMMDGANNAASVSLKMLSGIEKYAKSNFKNLKGDEAKEINKIIKDNNLFENLNKAKKDLENLMRGK